MIRPASLLMLFAAAGLALAGLWWWRARRRAAEHGIALARLQAEHAALLSASEAERARIARDLHEDIGARLLNQVIDAPSPAQAAAARATLGEVRGLIGMLDSRAFPLADCLVQWRAQFEQQCADAGVVAQALLPPQVPELQLDPAARGNPPRIAAEFVDNALRHAQPTRLSMEVTLDGGTLHLRLSHDGHRSQRAQWREARGLRNMALRAQDLQGRLEWHEEGAELRLELRFALADAAARPIGLT